MHSRDSECFGEQRKIDIEAVYDVACPDGKRTEQCPSRSTGDRPLDCTNRVGEFAHGVALHRCREIGLGQAVRQFVQELANVRLYAAASRPEGERPENDSCCAAAHPTTPNKSQK